MAASLSGVINTKAALIESIINPTFSKRRDVYEDYYKSSNKGAKRHQVNIKRGRNKVLCLSPNVTGGL